MHAGFYPGVRMVDRKMSEMVERVAKAIFDEMDIADGLDGTVAQRYARAAIEAMRELPEEPGPRYTAGEYSRKTQAAMVDDALAKQDQ